MLFKDPIDCILDYALITGNLHCSERLVVRDKYIN
jgi:hypothetical protein